MSNKKMRPENENQEQKTSETEKVSGNVIDKDGKEIKKKPAILRIISSAPKWLKGAAAFGAGVAGGVIIMLIAGNNSSNSDDDYDEEFDTEDYDDEGFDTSEDENTESN